MNSIIKKICIIIFWIAFWQVLSIVINNDILMPPLTDVMTTFITNISKPDFWLTILKSLSRIALGFLAGMLGGTILSLLSFKFKWIYDLILPIIQLLKSAPVVCFIVLLLVWVGTDYLDFSICTIVVVPIYFFAVYQGLKKKNKSITNMLNIYNVPKKIKWKIHDWYSISPYFKQATQTGLGVAWKSGVTAQMIGVVASTIGQHIYDTKISLNTAELLMWMIIVVFLAWITEKIIIFIINRTNTKYNNTSLISTNKHYCQNSNTDIKNPVIEISNASKLFGKKTIFKNVNIQINKGDKIAFVCATGSGKTTLLNCILGLDNVTKGSINTKKFLPRCFSVVFQENTLLENLDINQNIIAATQYSFTYKQTSSLIDSTNKPHELSGGMKRCAEIQRALLAESLVVIMDEPFAGLDDNTKSKAINYINEKINDRALILVTHNIDDTKKLGCKIVNVWT